MPCVIGEWSLTEQECSVIPLLPCQKSIATDQMSEGSQVSKVTICVKIQKGLPQTHSPTDQGRI